MKPAPCTSNDSSAKGKIAGNEQLEEAKQNMGSAKIGIQVSTASTSELLL